MMQGRVGMDREPLNTAVEGLIGIIVVVGAFVLMYTRINDATLMAGMLGTALGSVLTFYFSQRGSQQIQNGTLSALTQISDRMSQARVEAADTAARTVEATARTVQPATVVRET